MNEVNNQAIQPVPELIGPDYNVYQFRSDFYKVVKFKSTRPRVGGPVVVEDQEEMDPAPISSDLAEKKRLSQSLSRTRRTVLELALCNEWQWFVTLTISEEKADREDLEAYHRKFKQFLKDQNKKHGCKLRYLLIPELHSDGKSWHMHGFFGGEVNAQLQAFEALDKAGYTGPDGKKIPRKLIDRGYWDWTDYREKFGFCSFGQIRDKNAAAFYVSKYITKMLQEDNRKVGSHLYYASRGLKRSEFLDSVYGPCAQLDQCLTQDYQFCSTGFYSFDRQPGDDPMMDILEQQGATYGPQFAIPKTAPISAPASAPAIPEVPEALEYYETMQELLDRPGSGAEGG